MSVTGMRKPFDDVLITHGMIDGESHVRFELDSSLETLERAIRQIKAEAEEILFYCEQARDSRATKQQVNVALAMLFNIHDSAGASGPIGSQWARVLVASAQAQQRFLQIAVRE